MYKLLQTQVVAGILPLPQSNRGNGMMRVEITRDQ